MQKHHLDRRAAEIIEANSGHPDDLLKTRELADWLKVSPQWCEIARCQGHGPRFLRIGPSRIRYRRADVLAWLEERTHARTSEYVPHGEEQKAPTGGGVARYRSPQREHE